MERELAKEKREKERGDKTDKGAGMKAALQELNKFTPQCFISSNSTFYRFQPLCGVSSKSRVSFCSLLSSVGGDGSPVVKTA